MSREPKYVTEPTHTVDIWVCGDLPKVRDLCREYTYEVGLCVTIQAADFVYTGGLEDGVRVGLLNYPRFPTTESELMETAEELGVKLMRELYQTAVLIRGDSETKWIHRRDS